MADVDWLLQYLVKYASIAITVAAVLVLAVKTVAEWRAVPSADTVRTSLLRRLLYRPTEPNPVYLPLPPKLLWRKIGVLYAGTRLVLLAIACIFAAFSGKLGSPGFFGALADFWGKYDTPRYINIAATGYHETGEDQVNIAFYPLYPYLVRFVHVLIPNYFWAGVVVSNLFLLVGLYYLVRLAELEWHDSPSALRAANYLLLFPFTFFFSIVYTESVFVTMTILSFYALRKSRWLWAGVFGLLAAFTRNQGILLALPIAVEWVFAIREYVKSGSGKKSAGELVARFWQGGVAIILPAVGTFLYLLVNKQVTGDWFRFLVHQRVFWVQTFGFFAENLREHVYRVFHYHRPLFALGVWIPQVLLFFVCFALLIALANRFRLSYLAYSFAYLMISYSPTGLLSGPRYVSGMFTLYLFLACAAGRLAPAKRPYIDHILAALLLFYTTLFGMWYVF